MGEIEATGILVPYHLRLICNGLAGRMHHALVNVIEPVFERRFIHGG